LALVALEQHQQAQKALLVLILCSPLSHQRVVVEVQVLLRYQQE
jgi:hypothetical protein